MTFINTRMTLFAVLSAIEEDLRSVIATTLASQAATSAFDRQIFEKCVRRLADEEGFAPQRPTLEQLIIYSDLGDLYAVLNANSDCLPAPVAKYVKSVTPDLERLVPIRNRVCHIRPITFEDLPLTLDIANRFATTAEIPWSRLIETLTRLKAEPHYVLGLEIPSYHSDRKRHNLPSPDFDETGFLGRKRELDKLLKLCLGPYPVITIVGDGGIGKTALALKIAYDLLDDPRALFEAIVWCSSKTTQLTPKEIITIKDGIFDSLGVVRTLARELAGVTPADPLAELLTYLEEFRILVVLDNLETVLDERIRRLLEQLPSGSKILITSRIGVGAYEYPTKLEPLDEGESIQLVRALARARGVNQLVNTHNAQIAGYCKRLHNNPGFIKWFVSAVQSGSRPEDALANPDVFLDFCMSNVYKFLDSQSRAVLRSMLVISNPLSQAELAFLNDLASLELKKAIQQLLATNMVIMNSMPQGSSFASEYTVSELARAYLHKHHPIRAEEYSELTRRNRRLTGLKEQMQGGTSSDPYSIFSIAPRTTHDLVVVKYLRDALAAVRSHDFVTAQNLIHRAKDLSPDYYEVHRVEAWTYANLGNTPAACSAYEAAIQLAPDSAPLRFWFGGFLMRLDETERALDELRAAETLDPASLPIQIEIARVSLYLYRFDEARHKLESILNRNEMGERNQRKVWDLSLQVNRRQADYLLAQQDSVKALEALERLREVYESCPKELRDRKMMARLEDAASDIRKCSRFLEDEGLVNRAKDLAEWLECEGYRTPAGEIEMTVGERHKGTIQRVITEKKFGFIRLADGRTLFFHRSNLAREAEWGFVMQGVEVDFCVGVNEEGACADNIEFIELEGTKDRIAGVVRKVLTCKNYGFLTVDDGRDLFFHRSEVHRALRWEGLRPGTRVCFMVGKNNRGVCATDIRLEKGETPGGTPE